MRQDYYKFRKLLEACMNEEGSSAPGLRQQRAKELGFENLLSVCSYLLLTMMTTYLLLLTHVMRMTIVNHQDL